MYTGIQTCIGLFSYVLPTNNITGLLHVNIPGVFYGISNSVQLRPAVELKCFEFINSITQPSRNTSSCEQNTEIFSWMMTQLGGFVSDQAAMPEKLLPVDTVHLVFLQYH